MDPCTSPGLLEQTETRQSGSCLWSGRELRKSARTQVQARRDILPNGARPQLSKVVVVYGRVGVGIKGVQPPSRVNRERGVQSRTSAVPARLAETSTYVCLSVCIHTHKHTHTHTHTTGADNGALGCSGQRRVPRVHSPQTRHRLLLRLLLVIGTQLAED